ncbi:hypothetical protein HG536_0E02210 [Torulaspora globosa]|uniref:Prokaryotic-type class I peptide chain release factors domain-containing protein n=1 Tax=Torulaspora globosa TaxID=48254 RepID=A0A7G3ZIH4_9SACH|nr:uncharacterized protein HG536_0E02210 [Torulaspora globosa]QLL33310.1 hypothetical protein HG536_0E02210 [Torulaspora globosa]
MDSLYGARNWFCDVWFLEELRSMLRGVSFLFKRQLSSSYSPAGECSESLELAKQWLRQLNVHSVPLKLFSVRYDRSSGPGGQNVNKVNSKCTLVLYSFSSCSWIPEAVRDQLKEKNMRYYAKGSDSLVIQSDESRSRESNRQICVEKLVKEIKKTCKFPGKASEETLEKWDTIKDKANESRMRKKKLNSDRKKLRGKNNFTY